MSLCLILQGLVCSIEILHMEVKSELSHEKVRIACISLKTCQFIE